MSYHLGMICLLTPNHKMQSEMAIFSICVDIYIENNGNNKIYG